MLNLQLLNLMIFIVLQVVSCKGQDFQYEAVPKSYIPNINQKYVSEAQKLQPSATDLTAYLPSGYVRDGSVDYTSELQKGINSNNIILMPDFPVLTSGIRLRSASSIIFQKNSRLIMAPSRQVWYEVIEISKIHDVNLYFANIKGERDQHIGTKGEWGFGIGIESSRNIRILDPIISDCWGDGIYINNKTVTRQNATSDSNNIFIDGAQLDNNRRNGISIIDGNNITINKSVISNTNGTMPMIGIDLEPNNGNAELKNITIDSVITFNNENFGMFVSLTAFVSSFEKNINVVVKNCTDDGSKFGMGFAFGRTKDANSIFAKGTIDVINPVWKNNRSGQLWLPYYASKNSIVLKFQNAKVFKKGETKTSPLSPIILSNSKNIIFN